MQHSSERKRPAAEGAKRILGVGEAMIELSPAGDGLYRLGFAGDTFNTVWHMSQLLGDRASTGFMTRVGSDALSERFLGELAADGLDPQVVGQETARHMGLYLIELTGTERSFQYWRNESAAKRLADRPESLELNFKNADLIHVSGITLAVLSQEARNNLYAALASARKDGTSISFDPNIRPRLWDNLDQAKEAVSRMLEVVDIALPSFDDEKMLWGDDSATGTLRRYRDRGVPEVVVKNGADPVVFGDTTDDWAIPTPPVSGVRDTTGAGDAFNAGYLSARAVSQGLLAAVRAGQVVSAEVLKHPGARSPREIVRSLGETLFP